MRFSQQWVAMLQTTQIAIGEFPNDPQLYIERGFALQNGFGATNEAVETFKNAIKVDDTFPTTYVVLGNLMAQNQQYDEAYYWYSEAIKRNTDNVSWYILRANMARTSGDLALALGLYREIIEVFPDNATVYYEMAWAYRQNEQQLEATDSIERAIDLSFVEIPDYLIRAGLIYEWVGEQEKAIAFFEQVLLIEPENEIAQGKMESIKRKD
jgi:tetratricopeptide (TPR) repeat protein